MTLWLLTPNQTIHKLIDSEFHPAFYVHASPGVLQGLAHQLIAQFRVDCLHTERLDIWQGSLIPVLKVSLHDPLCFLPAVNLVRRTAPQARLYDSDLILATLYCWQKGVFRSRRWKQKRTTKDNFLLSHVWMIVGRQTTNSRLFAS